jgi:hypothetical protein
MQARIVSAARGARWLGEGWRLFRGAPLGWLAAVFGYWLIMTLISVVPLAGIAVAAILVPAFSVGFMAIARATSRGAPAEVALLFDGLRHEPRSQLLLGVAYLACLAAILALSALVDDGALASWMMTGSRPDDEVRQSQPFIAALFVTALLYLPVMAAFWFAPPLVAWHSTGAAKALFFSLAATLMNWRAFVAYGAVTAILTVVIPFATVMLITLASSMRFPAAGLLFPFVLVVLPTLFASFYASYRDVFGYDAAP